MWKKVIIGVIAALIVVGAAIFAVNRFADKPTENTEIVQTETENTESSETEQEVATESTESAESTESTEANPDKVSGPTFMYFISNSDSDFDKTNEVIEELKEEYEGKVNFDIRNIDVTPEDKDNFPVDGNTPMLIMLDKSNDICAFNPKCNDIQTLRESIELALQ